jgi:hypothetical protein
VIQKYRGRYFLSLPIVYLSSPSILNGVRVIRSLVFCVMFVDRCLSFRPFSFWHLVCHSIYGFGLPLWYLQTQIVSVRLRFTTSDYKEKGRKDKQRSTNITQKTKDRITRTPFKIEGELRCSGRVSSSWFVCDTRRVTVKRQEQHMQAPIYNFWLPVWYLQTFLVTIL